MRQLVLLLIVIAILGCSDDETPVTPQSAEVIADTTPPSVVSTFPSDGDTNVSVSCCISCTFSEPVNPSMIARWSFYLDADVAGTFSCSNCTAFFKSFYNLAYDRTYIATMAWCVTDTAGNELGTDYSWSFTTNRPPEVIDCFPADGAVEVPQDVVISATFSGLTSLSALTQLCIL